MALPFLEMGSGIPLRRPKTSFLERWAVALGVSEWLSLGAENHTMKITAEDIRAGYRRMSDEELLALDRRELTDLARKCYDEEVDRRGLASAAPQEDGSPAGEIAEAEPWEAAAECESAGEAWRVQSILESADIPARIVNRKERGVPSGGFQVEVPASMLDAAERLAGSREPDAIIVTARYENGAFIPLEEVDIAEGTVVEVHVPAAAFGALEN